jgi:hypothetical protein
MEIQAPEHVHAAPVYSLLIPSESPGDLFMSLIHSCELNGANPLDYLTELLRHTEELKQSPSEWMPWNYRATLAQLTTPDAA